jgi:DNA polymerase-3 subunit alpha
MSACAITDHGSMGGIIEFYKTSKDVGIKPIIGVEAYITLDEDGLENKDKTKDNMHCVMLAQNQEGLENLISLVNKAYLSNFYYKPRVSIYNLLGNTNGIIATSACLGGVVAKTGIFSRNEKVFVDPEGKAEKQLKYFSRLFGGRFYAEIQDLPIEEQKAYNQWLIAKAKENDIPLIIAADAHFLKAEDYQTHRLVMAKNMGKFLNEYEQDEDGLFYYKEHHVRSPDDMYKSACELGVEEAYWNTTKIAEQCNLEITLGEYKFPQFDITQESDYEDFLEWEKQYDQQANS